MSMPPRSPFASTLVRKFLMSLTGLVLVAFVIGHLAGNLLIFVGPEAFNRYSHSLISMGGLLIAVEIFLLGAFLIHVYTAITVTLENRRARDVPYRMLRSAGGPSHKSAASSGMIWSGLVLLVFTIIHLKTFKFGPGVGEGYVAQVQGEQVRDLYRLVVEVFQDSRYVWGYVIAMLLLGLHLRHGFWSAFESLGAHHPRYSSWIDALGYAIAVLLAIGFVAIPIWIHFAGVSP